MVVGFTYRILRHRISMRVCTMPISVMPHKPSPRIHVGSYICKPYGVRSVAAVFELPSGATCNVKTTVLPSTASLEGQASGETLGEAIMSLLHDRPPEQLYWAIMQTAISACNSRMITTTSSGGGQLCQRQALYSRRTHRAADLESPTSSHGCSVGFPRRT